jgi:hypothetical protein
MRICNGTTLMFDLVATFLFLAPFIFLPFYNGGHALATANAGIDASVSSVFDI